MPDIGTIAAESRDGKGKGSARSARRNGKTPAVIYGDKKSPETISLSTHELELLYKRGDFMSRLCDVTVAGDTVRTIPRDVQLDPVTDRPLHVDFLRLGAGATVDISVPVIFLGEEECPGLKTGGVLNVVRFEVELRCPANNMATQIEIDLSELDIGDSVHISSVSLPEGATPTITDRDFTIATIAAPSGGTEDEDEVVEGEEGEEAGEEGEGSEESDGGEGEKSEG